MGSWGPGIFSDDLAADVRAEWREAILAGEDAARASDALIARYGGGLFGEGMEIGVWVGVSVPPMGTRRPHAAFPARERALVDAGGDPAVWEASGPHAGR